MITIDCPCCDEPLRIDGLDRPIRCDGCLIEVELAPDAIDAAAMAA